MAEPPPTPPNSDIDGVREDQKRVDAPANAHPDPGAQLKHRDDQNTARPEGTDHRSKA